MAATLASTHQARAKAANPTRSAARLVRANASGRPREEVRKRMPRASRHVGAAPIQRHRWGYGSQSYHPLQSPISDPQMGFSGSFGCIASSTNSGITQEAIMPKFLPGRPRSARPPTAKIPVVPLLRSQYCFLTLNSSFSEDWLGGLGGLGVTGGRLEQLHGCNNPHLTQYASSYGIRPGKLTRESISHALQGESAPGLPVHFWAAGAPAFGRCGRPPLGQSPLVLGGWPEDGPPRNIVATSLPTVRKISVSAAANPSSGRGCDHSPLIAATAYPNTIHASPRKMHRTMSATTTAIRKVDHPIGSWVVNVTMPALGTRRTTAVATAAKSVLSGWRYLPSSIGHGSGAPKDASKIANCPGLTPRRL